MKNKIIRVIQPLSLLALIMLIICSDLFLYLGINRIAKGVDFYSVSILIIDVIVLICAIISVIKTAKYGVIFRENEFEFTLIDSNGKYEYKEIECAEGHRDAKVSFKKSFTDRYSSVILHLKDGDAATVELGYTTEKTLNKIVDEINERIK